MTKDNEKDTDKYYTKFTGDDAENTWWEYLIKTNKAIAEKNKWTSALETGVVTPSTKEQKMAEASGKHWFVMTCPGDALKYVRIHHEEGMVYKIWNELKTRYDGVEHNALQDLYAKVVDTIDNGPRDEDLLLWFSKSNVQTRKQKKEVED
jgi:hypothetical protein